MKKIVQLSIPKPCHENFEAMKPNSEGSFCGSCVKNVIDLSSKTNFEISQFIQKSQSKSVCVRMTQKQLQTDYCQVAPAKNASLKYAIAVAASVLLTSTVVSQDLGCKEPLAIAQKDTIKPMIMGKMIRIAPVVTRQVTLMGTVLENKTGKKVSELGLGKFKIRLLGTKNWFAINSKNGGFIIPKVLVSNNQVITFEISNDEATYKQKYLVNLKNNLQKIELFLQLEDEGFVKGEVVIKSNEKNEK